MLYYLHIPKSAGTSVRQVFSEIYRDRLIEVYGPDANYAACRPDSVLFGHFGFSLHRCLHDEEPSYMTLLRNPVDRVVSWYKHQARNPRSPFYEPISQSHLSLADIIQRGLAPEVNNHSVRILCVDYLNPRREKIRDSCSAFFLTKQLYQFSAKRHLKTAWERIEKYFCFAGTVDRLDVFQQFLARRNGLDAAAISVPVENVAPDKEFNLDPRTLRLVERANELDLELYNRINGQNIQVAC